MADTREWVVRRLRAESERARAFAEHLQARGLPSTRVREKQNLFKLPAEMLEQEAPRQEPRVSEAGAWR